MVTATASNAEKLATVSKTASNEGQVFTVLETALRLKISERTARELVATGEIRAIRLGRRIVRISGSEIDRILSGS